LPGGAAEGSGARYAELERSILAEALRTSGGNKTRAARSLGLPKSTFHDRLLRYGVIDAGP
jgi:two-component system C4-dicarboxylate transport response regulator DctD